jgi:3-oxoacyl-[acyl-carrier protein] reductase
MQVLLERKNAVIYGGGGAVGGAVARAFAAEGARVFLAGRTPASVEAVATEIVDAGGAAEAAQVDALDEQAVDRHLEDVVGKADRIDILFNAITMADIQGTPLLDMTFDDLAHPVHFATRTKFLTARAVARRMVSQGSGGVLMAITAEPTPTHDLGGFPLACAVVEAMWRSFATELGTHGIRTVIIRSPGSPDSPGVQEVHKLHGAADGGTVEAIQSDWGGTTMMGRLPLLAEVANAATLLASDRASAMTAAHANATCGAFWDL